MQHASLAGLVVRTVSAAESDRTVSVINKTFPEIRSLTYGQLHGQLETVSTVITGGRPGFRDITHETDDAVGQRERHCHADRLLGQYFDGTSLVQCPGDRPGVGTHEPTRTEPGSTEVADDDRGNIGQLPFEQHLKHGPASRAAWFTVVREAHVLPYLPGRTVMGRIRMFLARPLQQFLGRWLVVHRSDPGYEPGAFHCLLVFGETRDARVIHRFHCDRCRASGPPHSA